MASDWQLINTAIADPATGGLAAGFLLVTMATANLRLAGGGLVPAYRRKFTVTAGQALQDDGLTKMELPITEDANPANTPISLSFLDAQDRETPLGEVVVPRPAGADPYPAINLTDILPVGSL